VLRVPTIKIRYEDENRVRARDLYMVSDFSPCGWRTAALHPYRQKSVFGFLSRSVFAPLEAVCALQSRAGTWAGEGTPGKRSGGCAAFCGQNSTEQPMQDKALSLFAPRDHSFPRCGQRLTAFCW